MRKTLTPGRVKPGVGFVNPRVRPGPSPPPLSGMSFTTRDAAMIVGVEWETLRTWKRKGLMARSGKLARLFGEEAEPEDRYTMALAWSFGHLCGYRLVKHLLSVAYPFEAAASIVGQQVVWDAFMRRQYAAENKGGPPMPDEFLVIEPRLFDIVGHATLADIMAGLTTSPPAAVITLSLEAVRRDVVAKIEALARGELA